MGTCSGGEKVFEAEPGKTYPTLVKGAMACPPEDCGGIWGFENFVKAMKKQEGDEYEEYAEWYGDDFDPDEFDMVEINKVSFKDFKKSMDSWSRYDAM